MSKPKASVLITFFLVFLLTSCSLVSPIRLERWQWGSLHIPPGYEHITQKQTDKWWELTYETAHQSTFTGLVRHTTRINERKYPMLTHDILITSGDFADSDLVRTSVTNHHFIWSSREAVPQGNINLLHTMPMNEEALNGLYEIEYGDIVTIKGYEIYEIRYYRDSSYLGMWKDAGCNTLLVTEVIIHDTP